MEDIMSRLFPHIDSSVNRTIQSNTNKYWLLQEEPTSTNTSTKTLCSKCQRSFKLLCGLSQHKQKYKDDELTDSIIKSTLDVNKELSNNTEFCGNHSIDDLKQTISVIMKI